MNAVKYEPYDKSSSTSYFQSWYLQKGRFKIRQSMKMWTTNEPCAEHMCIRYFLQHSMIIKFRAILGIISWWIDDDGKGNGALYIFILLWWTWKGKYCNDDEYWIKCFDILWDMDDFTYDNEFVFRCNGYLLPVIGCCKISLQLLHSHFRLRLQLFHPNCQAYVVFVPS